MKHLRYLLMAALVAMPLMACDEDSDPVEVVTIYGTVTGTVSAEGTGLSGVGVTLVGSTSLSSTTGAGGTYTFTNVEAGGYGVSIDASTHSDVSFSQTSRTTTIATSGETVTVDFGGSYIRTATITGVVSASGAPLGGIAVTVTGGGDNATNNSVTNAGGEYFATGLRAGAYTVSFTAPAGVTFATTSAAVTVATGETKTAHFPGAAVQLATISGAVTVDNVGTAGITVTLGGAAAAATETGPGGAYTVTNLTPGAYTVTVTAPANVTFGTSVKNVTVGEGDNGVVNFAGVGPPEAATISGAVTVDDVGRAGVAVALAGPVAAATETGAGGAYSFSNLTAGVYTVTITQPANTTFGVLAKGITVAAGDNGVVNFAGAGPVEPATISIQSITTGAGVPVILTAVMGQIEVSLNIIRGDRDLEKVDVVFTNEGGTPIIAATQTFANPAPPAEAAAGDDELITLSIPTNQVRLGTNTYVPVIFNGKANISANLWEVGAAAPIPTNDVPVVMTNADVLMSSDGALIPGIVTRNGEGPTDIPTLVPVAVWNTGGLMYDGPIYISFSTTVQVASWAAGACLNGVGATAGTAATGITLSNTWACAAVEAQNQTPGIALPVAYVGLALGPDGTAVGLPANWSALGASFPLGGETRWYVLTPGPAGLTAPAVFDIDNVGPTITMAAGAAPGTWGVAFNAAFDQPWINASYALAQDATWVDAGVGNDLTTQQIHLWDAVPIVPLCLTGTAYVTGNDLVETIASDGTPDGYQICASGADLLGNVGLPSGASNWFGVDWVNPTVRLAESTIATPLLAGALTAPIFTLNAGTSTTPLSTLADVNIFSIVDDAVVNTQWGNFDANMVWGLEAQDTRSGFDQVGAAAGFPAAQTLTATDILGTTSCATIVAERLLPTVLSDNWVRTLNQEAFTCDVSLKVPAYYAYTGKVTDRAGNSASVTPMNWMVDQTTAATINSVSFFGTTFYNAGQNATFVMYGIDNLEVIEAQLGMSYPVAYDLNVDADLTNDFFLMVNNFTPGIRWDGLPPAFDAGLFTTAVSGLQVTIPTVPGRIDQTCSAVAGIPYASCVTAHTVAPTATQFNSEAGGLNPGMLPGSVTAVSFTDAGMNPYTAPTQTATFIPAQWQTSTAQPWSTADIVAWQDLVSGTNTVAQHTASTSITEPYFDSVLLVHQAPQVAGTATITVCGTYPAPTLTDNGLNRFWTYTLVTPTTGVCAAAGTLHAMGVKGDARLMTQ